LKIEKQELENHQVKLVVEIDQSLLNEAKRRAASRLAKRTKIPGFRPGKAPYTMVVRHLGEAVVLEDAIELLIDDIYPKVIEEAGIETYGPGHLEEIKSLDPPIFEFVVALAPTVEMGDYHTIRIPYVLEEISEEQVDNALKYIQEQNAVIERVERSAQAGDQVRLRFSADRTDSHGATSILYNENPLTVILPNEGEVIEQYLPVPGFDQSLFGKSAGEATNLVYTYPTDTAIESLRGVQAEFKIQVEQVYSRILPALDDELAKSVGDFETLDELRVATRKQLEAQARDQYNSDYDEEVLEQLVEMSTVVYPPQMLEHEIDHLVEQLADRLENQKLDMDLYLKSRSMDMDALREETRPIAENRLKRSLVFFEVSEMEGIHVDPKQLETETLRTLEYYSRILPENEFKRLANKESSSSLVGNIMSELVIDNTKEFLRAIAQGKEPHHHALVDDQAPSNEDNNSTTEQTALSEASPLELDAREIADLISVDDNADAQE
jgi:trigger factor